MAVNFCWRIDTRDRRVGDVVVVKSSEVVEPVLSFRGVSKVYDSGAGDRYALREVSFDLSPGQRVAVQGRSGSGKSTLLHLAAGIDLPSEGEVWIEGRNLANLSERDKGSDQIGVEIQHKEPAAIITLVRRSC